MSLWVKKAQAEIGRKNSFLESLNRAFPMPFEERRGRVGMISYKSWRWFRFLPFIGLPMICVMLVMESRDVPHENVFTALHLWLADYGLFRHDTIKALNPAFEAERIENEHRTTDRKWRLTGSDILSERELREFAAINIEKQRMAKEREARNTVS